MSRKTMLNKSREFQIGTYVSRFAAPEFQKMIRAEAGAQPSGNNALAMVNGKAEYVYRRRGECVCVTCGKVRPWSTPSGDMQTGHFLASRCFAILFVEEGANPQCSGCNGYHGGRPQAYRIWMEHVHGQEVIERLEALKRTTRHFSRDELVDMRIEYKRRLKEAERAMNAEENHG